LEEDDDLKFLEEYIAEQPVNIWLWLICLGGFVLSVMAGVELLEDSDKWRNTTVAQVLGILSLVDALMLAGILFYSRIAFGIHVLIALVFMFIIFALTKSGGAIIKPVVHLVVLSVVVSRDWSYFDARAKLRTLRKAQGAENIASQESEPS
jgi:hypothetical protein